MQISDFSDNEAKYAYLKGLQPKIQDLVISQKENFRDVRTLQAACLRYDNGIRNSGNNGNIEANMATSNNGQKFGKRPFGHNHGNHGNSGNINNGNSSNGSNSGNHANSGNGGNNGNSNGGGNNAKNAKKLPKPRICA